jgi:hypothetical protein
MQELPTGKMKTMKNIVEIIAMFERQTLVLQNLHIA